jgi:hypothetical protein
MKLDITFFLKITCEELLKLDKEVQKTMSSEIKNTIKKVFGEKFLGYMKYTLRFKVLANVASEEEAITLLEEVVRLSYGTIGEIASYSWEEYHE